MNQRFSWLLILALPILALAAAGCDDGDGDVDGSVEIDAGPGTDGGEFDAGPGGTGDGNDSFAEADPVTLGEPVDARINPAGDLDYFSFEGTEGDWIVIDTEGNPDNMDGLIDTVVTLYDSSMTQIAENDDGLPRVSPDSELITRLPSTGTYYVLVQEFSSWPRNMQDPPTEPEGMATFVYTLLVSTLDEELAAINVDTEPNDDAASAQPLGRAGNFGLMAGTFEGADVDAYEFVMGGNPNPNFFIMPIGMNGYGAPAMPTSVWVTNEAGDEIIARLTPDTDGQSGMFEFDPNLPVGRYNFFVEGADGGSYVIKSFLGGDNPPEAEEVTNDLPATPEMLEFTPVEDMMEIERAFVLAQLPDGDTDHYAVTAAAGDVISVSCGSRTSGSGIQDLTIDITDALGMPLAGAQSVETATENAFIDEFTPPSAGDYRVRLTRGAQISDVTGVWVRCGITVGPPAPMM